MMGHKQLLTGFLLGSTNRMESQHFWIKLLFNIQHQRRSVFLKLRGQMLRCNKQRKDQ